MERLVDIVITPDQQRTVLMLRLTDGRVLRLPSIILDEIRRVADDPVRGFGGRDLIVNKHIDANGRTHYTVDLDETPGGDDGV